MPHTHNVLSSKPRETTYLGSLLTQTLPHCGIRKVLFFHIELKWRNSRLGVNSNCWSSALNTDGAQQRFTAERFTRCQTSERLSELLVCFLLFTEVYYPSQDECCCTLASLVHYLGIYIHLHCCEGLQIISSLFVFSLYSFLMRN